MLYWLPRADGLRKLHGWLLLLLLLLLVLDGQGRELQV